MSPGCSTVSKLSKNCRSGDNNMKTEWNHFEFSWSWGAFNMTFTWLAFEIGNLTIPFDVFKTKAHQL